MLKSEASIVPTRHTRWLKMQHCPKMTVCCELGWPPAYFLCNAIS